MLNDMNGNSLFCDYYKQWVDVYKKDAIREATMSKYKMTQKWVERLAPELKVCEMSRTAYQQILNEYAKEHIPHIILGAFLIFAAVQFGVDMAEQAGFQAGL